MKIVRALLLSFAAFSATAGLAATINNDDSCDVAVLPAATLLLPYFEVDLDNFNRETTLFTLTNVTNLDRIARVTLWTDRSYPVIAFNIYLTGYDVQSINLFDVMARGIIAPDQGTGTDVTKRGSYSDFNPAIDLSGCGRLPGALDPVYVDRMQSAFRVGTVPKLGPSPACNQVGGVHANAVGYATIDVVRTCSSHLPTERAYWLEDIAFENVLTGDYQQVDSVNNFAQGNPLVHIRAIPEGGTPVERRAQPAAFDAGFPRTFYSRYQAASEPRFDGRQPLPSTFAARWIEGSSSSFQTSLKVWREGTTGPDAACGDYAAQDELYVTDVVRFDEAENAFAGGSSLGDPPIGFTPMLPPTSRTSVSDGAVFPHVANGAVAGWVYLNLDRCGLVFPNVGPCADGTGAQAWVVTSMRAEGRYSTDADATALGNGCSQAQPSSEVSRSGGVVIGPAANQGSRP
ncbi:MAG: hypothetical protein ABI779_00565, partial [Acidobacteriota bacterium]